MKDIYRVKFEADTIRTRLREVAFLNSSASISFRAASGAAGADGLSITESLATHISSTGSAHGTAEPGSSAGNGDGGASVAAAAAAAAASPVKGTWESFHFSGGLEEYVRYNNRDNTPMHDPIYISRTVSCCWRAPFPLSLYIRTSSKSWRTYLAQGFQFSG